MRTTSWRVGVRPSSCLMRGLSSLVLLSSLESACSDSSDAATISPSRDGGDIARPQSRDAQRDDTLTPPADGGARDSTVQGDDVVDASRALGASCAVARDCASTFCINAHCCSSVCSSPCSTCGSTGTCADVAIEAGTACGTALACDGRGNCRKTDGQACTLPQDCSSGQCVAGTCGLAAMGCGDLAAHSRELVQEPALLERTWPLGNPPGQAVLVGGDFDAIVALCFDGEAIALSYQDPGNAMIILPLNASVGPHSLAAIGMSGTTAAISVNVTSDFGTEFSVAEVSGTGASKVVTTASVFTQSSTPFIPTTVGNYPPFDNTWGGGHIGSWLETGAEPGNAVYRDWDAGIGFSLSGSAGYSGGITATRNGRRLSVIAHVGPANTIPPPDDAEVPVSQSYVGLFVCGIDSPVNFVSVAASCGYRDGGTSLVTVVGNPECQVQCNVQGILRVIMFPDAPAGHQVLLTK
jgi:hypothetical protein